MKKFDIKEIIKNKVAIVGVAGFILGGNSDWSNRY